MTTERIKILGAILELPAKQQCQFNPFGPFLQYMGWIFSAIWQVQKGPQDFDFFNSMGANYSLELNSSETYSPKFFGLNNLFLGSVNGFFMIQTGWWSTKYELLVKFKFIYCQDIDWTNQYQGC